MVRVQRLKREAAAYIMLRRKGVSINQIAQVVGRSTSLVHRILKKVNLNRYDMRKLPSRIKLLAAQRIRLSMGKLRAGWIAFILGEVEKPP